MLRTQARTDWPALALSLLTPAIAVAGFLWTALQESPWAETPGWALGLFVLPPLEGLRAFVMSVTARIYRDYSGKPQAIVSFLCTMVSSVCFVAGIVMLPGRHSDGVSLQDLSELFATPWIWEVVLVPMLFTLADAILGLLLFRGDVDEQAMRFDAVAKISGFWLTACLVYPLFFVLSAGALFVRFGGEHGVDWVFTHSRTILSLYAAFYFAGKAILLAYLHTGRFVHSGRLPIWGDTEDAIDERRAVLLGKNAPTLKELTEQTQRSA